MDDRAPFNDRAPIDDRCRREIDELHDFFQGWLSGTTARSDGAFDRLRAVLADSFELISPDGRRAGRDALIAQLEAAHGSRPDGFRIWIREFQSRPLGAGFQLATYEEWQELAGKQHRRLSTAVFRRRPDSPCGVEWQHVHETALPLQPQD